MASGPYKSEDKEKACLTKLWTKDGPGRGKIGEIEAGENTKVQTCCKQKEENTGNKQTF